MHACIHWFCVANPDIAPYYGNLASFPVLLFHRHANLGNQPPHIAIAVKNTDKSQQNV
jgi:hypothetical protein